MTPVSRFLADLLERAVKTIIQVYLLLLGASGMAEEAGVTDWSSLKKFAYSAIGGAISVVFSLISKGIGRHDSASAVPTVAVE